MRKRQTVEALMGIKWENLSLPLHKSFPPTSRTITGIDYGDNNLRFTQGNKGVNDRVTNPTNSCAGW